MKPSGAMLLLACVLAGPAGANTPPGGAAAPDAPTGAPTGAEETPAERMGKRWPQPVRVGDLAGRDVLQPLENQPVLGRVLGIEKRADGGLALLMRYGGFHGIGGRPIAVPIEAIGLLGEHVAVLDYPPDQLDKFPDADPAAAKLPADAVIRVAIVRPFH